MAHAGIALGKGRANFFRSFKRAGLDLSCGRCGLSANDRDSIEAHHGGARKEGKGLNMSPNVALHDPVFRLYVAIAVAILLLAGLVLGMLRWVLHKDVTSAWRTYRSWLIIAPLIIGLIWAGRAATIIGFTLVA